MNNVGLVGRLTKDPVLRQISEGRVQTSFTLAINRNFKNQKGEVEADFVHCTIWGRLAENTAKHCGKGSLIGVAGRIQSRSYLREDRSRVYVTEVVGEDVRFILTKKRENENLYQEPSGVLNESSQTTKTEDEETKNFNLPTNEKEGLPIF